MAEFGKKTKAPPDSVRVVERSSNSPPPELLGGSVDCARDQVNGTVVLFGRHQASGARNGSELGLSRVGLAAFFSEPAKLMLRVQDV